MSWWRRPLEALLNHPRLFVASQVLGAGTLRRYRLLLERHVPVQPGDRLLDVGCGVGAFQGDFACTYIGVDYNADYMRNAVQSGGPGRFAAMDATRLAFADEVFDRVVTIAVLHHLSDSQVLDILAEAQRVAKPGAGLHIVEAILPVRPGDRLKEWIFRHDRGRHPRSLETLRALLDQRGRVAGCEVLQGFPHDVCWLWVLPL